MANVGTLAPLMVKSLPKLIVVCGPTASGKTQWGVDLATRFNGSVISADSRQIYKKMSIGTAQPVGEWRRNGLRKSFFVQDIPHHLIGWLDPGKVFSAAEFRDRALKYSKVINRAGRVPFVVGGTGLYISALVDNFTIPRVPASHKLRQSLEEKPLSELVSLLQRLDPEAAAVIDTHNPRRLIRALEVCILTGEQFSAQKKKGAPLFDVLQIGIRVPRDVLYERINTRVELMIKAGLLAEVQALLKQKYSWNLPSMNGIGYREFRDYMDGAIGLDEVVERIKQNTRQYARRQLTWFNRDHRIVWCDTVEEAAAAVERFLGR